MKSGVGRNSGEFSLHPTLPWRPASPPRLHLFFPLPVLPELSFQCFTLSILAGTTISHLKWRGSPAPPDCTPIGQNVPYHPPALPPHSLFPRFRPQDVLLGIRLRTHLEKVLPSLNLVSEPAALRGGPILRPVEQAVHIYPETPLYFVEILPVRWCPVFIR
jgi:hypothetical protein